MSRPKLTIGMATHEDYYGTRETIQKIKSQEPSHILDQLEIVVVDQAPDGSHGKDVRGLVQGYAWAGIRGAKYVPYTERLGTSASRDKVLEEASGEVVICCDCHIEFMPGAIQSVLDYFDSYPDSKDIVSGPILTEAIWYHGRPDRAYSVMGTHFSDHMRARMWGTWASASTCWA